MNTTENYGLKKPEATDFFNVEDFNSNMDAIDKEIKDCYGKVIFSEDPLNKQDVAGKWKRATIYINDLIVTYAPNVGSIGTIDLRNYIEEEILDFLVVSLGINSSLYFKKSITEMRSAESPVISLGSTIVDEFYEETGNGMTSHYSPVIEVLYKVAD